MVQSSEKDTANTAQSKHGVPVTWEQACITRQCWCLVHYKAVLGLLLCELKWLVHIRFLYREEIVYPTQENGTGKGLHLYSILTPVAVHQASCQVSPSRVASHKHSIQCTVQNNFIKSQVVIYSCMNILTNFQEFWLFVCGCPTITGGSLLALLLGMRELVTMVTTNIQQKNYTIFFCV